MYAKPPKSMWFTSYRMKVGDAIVVEFGWRRWLRACIISDNANGEAHLMFYVFGRYFDTTLDVAE